MDHRFPTAKIRPFLCSEGVAVETGALSILSLRFDSMQSRLTDIVLSRWIMANYLDSDPIASRD
jgi:hypothetical protein